MVDGLGKFVVIEIATSERGLDDSIFRIAYFKFRKCFEPGSIELRLAGLEIGIGLQPDKRGWRYGLGTSFPGRIEMDQVRHSSGGLFKGFIGKRLVQAGDDAVIGGAG